MTLAVWGALERNPFFTIVAISLVQHGHVPPPEPPFSMASAARTTALLEGAGFSSVRTEEVPVRFEVPDVEEYLSVISDIGPLGLARSRALRDGPRGGQGRGRGLARAPRPITATNSPASRSA